MRRLKINRIDFESLFEAGSDEATAYLDVETGAVLVVEDYTAHRLEDYSNEEQTLEAIEAAVQSDETLPDWERAQLVTAARIEWDDTARYRLLPIQDTRQSYREMQMFIGALEDEELRDRLESAIHGTGAFRRFKDVLHRHPTAQAEWFTFRDARQHERILEWFADQELEPEFE